MVVLSCTDLVMSAGCHTSTCIPPGICCSLLLPSVPWCLLSLVPH